MSYLQYPRLIFSGKFQADPSTVNNDPEHFDTSRFMPNYDELGEPIPNTPFMSNGWWNPKGTGAWRFRDCKVQQVQYLDGTSCDNSVLDPVVGMQLNSVVDRVEGKLVDLDPEQQMVSAIWGFQVFLGAKNDAIGFGGDYEVASFGDIWVRYAAGQPDSFFSAYYQSAISLTKQILGTADSRFLKELQAALAGGSQLSIKFTVDGYVDDTTSPEFTFGRITGAIGAQLPNEPLQFVSGRTLNGTGPVNGVGLNTAYGLVQGNFLHLDLGNSLPTKSAGGSLVNFGNLMLAVNGPNNQQTILGEVHYAAPDWYLKTAGIVTFPLTAAQQALVAANPLSLVQISSINPTVTYAAEQATYVRADQFVFRFNPPQTLTATLYATNLGKPMNAAQISFCLDSTQMVGQQNQGPIPGPPAGTPNPSTGQYPVTFPGATAIEGGYSITTDSNGNATITMAATDPGNPRGYVDGQVFGVAYQLGSTPPTVGAIQNPSLILNLLIFNEYKIPALPTWIADVSPIFTQYAELYPVMKPIVDLSNFGSVMQRNFVLKNVFSTPETNSNYMPVTRDLSKPKREMLLKWLDNPVYFDLNSVEQLKMALQTAIELEHSTIPVYLTALYSIMPNTNLEVSSVISSIVAEEMLHMTLACNILISIGGSPAIGKKGFIPNYPGSLPGGLRDGLVASLKKCSIEQIRDVFMNIEMPSQMIEERFRWLKPNAPLESAQYTIGWFYDQIKQSLTNLSNSGAITFGNADKQVSEWHGTGNLYVVSNLADAINAIDEIIEQGEGNSATNPYDNDNELSHYYKFSEIVEGRRLVNTKEGYAYIGPRIPFNPSEVYPMVDNPSLVTYPAGSRAEILSKTFDESYRALLNSLHTTFNGHPDNLRNAIGAMYSVGLQMVELMQTPSGLNDGTTAGPRFRLPG